MSLENANRLDEKTSHHNFLTFVVNPVQFTRFRVWCVMILVLFLLDETNCFQTMFCWNQQKLLLTLVIF